MRITLPFLLLLLPLLVSAQQINPKRKILKVVAKDTVRIDSVSINPAIFKVKTANGAVMDSTKYSIDFAKAELILLSPVDSDSITIEYLNYPDYLTRTYSLLPDSIIVPNTDNVNRLLKLSQSTITEKYTPFDGLTTSGSIARGITIGNNQNSVLNSELDLQISGKLSENVSLRASIQDANIPLQEAGYSQRLDEFDQVFIEILSNDWNIRAGDIDLINRQSYFAKFTKRVQGLLVNIDLDGDKSETNLFASGALVRGQFTTSKFTAQEGNQGPYKLRGPNEELFVLIVSGSETVYVDGIPLERGETEDYIIDYNAGELIFNSTYPVTSEMRITVDYQFSDRNYSRFIAYGGGNVKSEKFNLGVSVYSEADAKNQPLQQNLSSEQVNILSQAGDDRSQMLATSVVPETYSENRILYRKILIDGQEVFEFSTDANEELFSVRFSFVGQGLGNYNIANTEAINTIFEYVAPLNGTMQGNYEPVIQLIAPEKLQIATLNGVYTPNEKTQINFELTGSKNDLNLFSDFDDNDNDGFAGKLRIDQQIIKRDSVFLLKAYANADVIQEEFKTIERLYSAEFNRDWNLRNPLGDQILSTGGLQFSHIKSGLANYSFQHLEYAENFRGFKHNLFADLDAIGFRLFSKSSFLSTDSDFSRSEFFRTHNRLVRDLNNKWVGIKFVAEDNSEQINETNELTNLSQRFYSEEIFAGIGDSTKVYAEIGYKYRVNDSVRNNTITRVNSSNTYFLRSQIIKNNNSDLGLFVNYRNLKYNDDQIGDENSLNSRLLFNQKLFKNIVVWNTAFETNAGSLPQQNFTFVQVEEGRGNYTWNDYNENNIQELNEFEIAQFQDQGEYIRVLLPNQIFVKTHQNRLSQALTLNFGQWSASNNTLNKFLSHFYNQSTFLIDRKIKREGNNFDLNPFKDSDDLDLGLNQNIRNTLFYNRGKQNFTTSYTYIDNENKALLSIGFQQSKSQSHQLHFNHKFGESWLFNFTGSTEKNENSSENYPSRDYELDIERLFPKLSYLFSENARFDVFYEYATNENLKMSLETLLQNKFGLSFTYNTAQKLSLNGEISYINNDFEGNTNSPVAYQMLQGLQPGKNLTWRLLAQKKLTKFLDLNLNYLGRKSESSRTIHTGTVQLKAYF